MHCIRPQKTLIQIIFTPKASNLMWHSCALITIWEVIILTGVSFSVHRNIKKSGFRSFDFLEHSLKAYFCLHFENNSQTWVTSTNVAVTTWLTDYEMKDRCNYRWFHTRQACVFSLLITLIANWGFITNIRMRPTTLIMQLYIPRSRSCSIFIYEFRF